MRLYFFPVAPNPTKVRLYLAEKIAAGATVEVEQVQVDFRTGEQNTDAFRARSPMARVPALELQSGETIIESLPIIELIEELHPDPPMIGGDPVARARVRALERVADLDVQSSSTRYVHSTNSPLGMEPNPAVAERAKKSIPAGLRLIENALADGRPFVAGDSPTIADTTLAAGFQFARFGQFDLTEAFPEFEAVCAWDQRYRARKEVAGVLVL